MTERCPACKQIVRHKGDKPLPTRVCYDCGHAIARHHKYTFADRGGISVIVHRVCSNPESYYRTAKCKRLGVVGYRGMTKEQVAAATAREDELELQFAQWRHAAGRVDP